MSDALTLLREERRRLLGQLKKLDRAIRALGGRKRGRKPGRRARRRREAATAKA